MSRVADEGAEAFGEARHLLEDLFGIQFLAAISFDDPVRVFEIAFDARAQNFRHQRVGSADAAAAGFIFISRSNAAQRGANFLVAEPLFAGVIQSAMVGKYQMGAGADLDAFGRNFDALRHQTIGFFKKSLGIDHHAIAEHADLAPMNDA